MSLLPNSAFSIFSAPSAPIALILSLDLSGDGGCFSDGAFVIRVIRVQLGALRNAASAWYGPFLAFRCVQSRNRVASFGIYLCYFSNAARASSCSPCCAAITPKTYRKSGGRAEAPALAERPDALISLRMEK